MDFGSREEMFVAELGLQTVEVILEKREPLASNVPEARHTTPVVVLTGEAIELAQFVSQHWEPRESPSEAGESGEGVPGMKSALVGGLIDESIAQDLLDLASVVAHAHATVRALKEKVPEAPVKRGVFLLSEIRKCSRFLFGEGVVDERDAALARLTESHNDTSSHGALAMSLEGFAFYANRFRARLATLPDFDPALLDEALVVAHRLRAQSSLKASLAAKRRHGEALALRNRLLTLLIDRMNRTRRAARFVFRHHPAIARLAGSAYERRRRRRYRGRKPKRA